MRGSCFWKCYLDFSCLPKNHFASYDFTKLPIKCQNSTILLTDYSCTICNMILWNKSKTNIAYKLEGVVKRGVSFKAFVISVKLCFHLTDHVILLSKRFSVNPKWLRWKLWLKQIELLREGITCTFKSSPLEMFLGKAVLKLCNKFTGEHPCKSLISIKLQSKFCKFQNIFLWEHVWRAASAHCYQYTRQPYLSSNRQSDSTSVSLALQW